MQAVAKQCQVKIHYQGRTTKRDYYNHSNNNITIVMMMMMMMMPTTTTMTIIALPICVCVDDGSNTSSDAKQPKV